MSLQTTQNILRAHQSIADQLSSENIEWLTHFRQQGLSRFEALGLPSKKSQDWRYTQIEKFFQRNLKADLKAELSEDFVAKLQKIVDQSHHVIVLVNGQFSSDWSKIDSLIEQLEFSPLQNLLTESRIEEFKPYLSKLEKDPQRSFNALNQAFLRGGLYFNVPAKLKMKDPIRLIHVQTGDTEMALYQSFNLFKLGEQSEIKLLEYSLGTSTGAYINNQFNFFHLAQAAHFEHAKVLLEGQQAFSYNQQTYHLEAAAQLDTLSLSLDGQLNRNELEVQLKGKDAQVKANGLYVNNGHQQTDNYSLIRHIAAQTYSTQLYKGLLDQNAKAVFTGQVKVDPQAQQVDSSQHNKNLLLSPQAHVHTMPQLEILADDVKCAHGATVGQLSDEQLFYLTSRGIEASKARQMLALGFAQEILLKFPNKAIRDRLTELLESKIQSFDLQV